MSSIKNLRIKIKLSKYSKRSKWAPYWAVIKKYGIGRKVHPSRITEIKRNWRRNKTKI
jgi:ribosomal protein L39E